MRMLIKKPDNFRTIIYTNEAIVSDRDYNNDDIRLSRDIKIGSIDIKDDQFDGYNSTISWWIVAHYDPTWSYIKEDGTYEYDPESDSYVSTPDIYATEPQEGIGIKKIIAEKNKITNSDMEVWEHDPSIASYCNIDCKDTTHTKRSDLYNIPEIGKMLKKYLPNKWWENMGDDFAQSLANSNAKGANADGDNAITAPNKFKNKYIDKITNFNPSTDTLEIDTETFGIDSSATFRSGKNKKVVKKKLAKQDFDFLYDQKKGGLYFNENGADKGFGEGGIIAILKGGPDLTASSLEFI